MPHCIIEYAADIPAISPKELLTTVQQTVEESPLFNANDVRSRLQPIEHYRLGADKSYFLHVTVKLLAGRSDAEKSTLAQQITEAIQSLGVSDILVSCECVDIQTPSYQRLAL